MELLLQTVMKHKLFLKDFSEEKGISKKKSSSLSWLKFTKISTFLSMPDAYPVFLKYAF